MVFLAQCLAKQVFDEGMLSEGENKYKENSLEIEKHR